MTAPRNHKRSHQRSDQILPRVAISTCLTGERVRYDGAAQEQPALLDALRGRVALVPVCPEVGIGMGVPRPPVRRVVVGDADIRVLGRDQTDLDVTDALQDFAATTLQQLLDAGDLCGWIFKSRSPSCGLGSTPYYTAGGLELGTGDGVQAAAVRQRAPWMVLREETALAEPAAQRQFIGLCRLVWILRYSDHSLPELDAHLQPLIALLPPQTRRALGYARTAGQRDRYGSILGAAAALLTGGEWLDVLENR